MTSDGDDEDDDDVDEEEEGEDKLLKVVRKMVLWMSMVTMCGCSMK